jgi:hypothetical protein
MMKTKTQPTKFVCLSILLLILSSLACSVDLGGGTDNNLSAEQTLVALQLTQAALDSSAEEDSQIDEEEPAEEIPTPDVVYEGISFSFNPQIGSNLNSVTIPMQNLGEESMPSETYPTHFEFTFDIFAVNQHFHTPKIIVFPVDEFVAISPYAADIINNLQQALVSHPSGGVNSNLPFLPMWNAAQLFTAKVVYFNFQNGSGVRFLTMYGQDIYPVDNTNLIYTYQGLTDDGRFYITAVMPVTNPGLPDSGDEVLGDYMTFDERWDSYISDTIAWLNFEDPDNFLPSIVLLDEMMASFKIER